jgi:hypothetical protein
MTRHQAEKLFSFASWATDHPSDPIPGDRVDIQFDNHRAAILALTEAVENLLRADGKLNHDLITPESLPRGITTGLILDAKSRIDGYLDPLLARTQYEQRQLESTQLDLLSQLHEIKARQRETQELLDAVQHLSSAVQNSTRNGLSKLSQALQANARFIEARALDDESSVTAQKWAEVSTVWAEYMDGNATIPPNILATNGITGDHWSSRWWANRSAQAFGQMAWWYQGAFAGPPPSTPNDPTGQPLPPGAIYWDTVTNKMMVWSGTAWMSTSAPAPAIVQSLYYVVSSGSQSAFPLTTLDRFGKNFALSATSPEGINAYKNGLRLEPNNDFTVNVATSTVTTIVPLTTGQEIIFDLLTPANMLKPSGSANALLCAPLTLDGVQTTFALSPASGTTIINVGKSEELIVTVDGVVQQPGGAYSALGANIVFVEAPSANALVVIVWLGPASSAGGAGGVSSVAGRTGDIVLIHTDITDWASATSGFGGGGGAVSSVAGRTGDVVLTHVDITDWTSVTSGFGNASLVISPTPPVGPAVGTLWWDSTGGQMYIRYNDGDTQQWVAVVNEAGSSSGGSGTGTITAGTTPTSGFTAGQLMMSDGTKIVPDPTTIASALGLTTFSLTTHAGSNLDYYYKGLGLVVGGVVDFGDGKTELTRGPVAGVLAQQMGTNVQAFRVYNTYTDASNGEWAALDWQTTPNVLTIGTQANGTGVQRPIAFSGGVVAVNFVRQAITASSATLSINQGAGENVALTLSATVTTFTVTNWPALGTTGKLRLVIASTGAFNITGWPAGTIWPGGTAPTITSGAGKKDIILLMTDDNGATIYGSVVGQNYS